MTAVRWMITLITLAFVVAMASGRLGGLGDSPAAADDTVSATRTIHFAVFAVPERWTWLACELGCCVLVAAMAMAIWSILGRSFAEPSANSWFGLVWLRSQALAILPFGQVGGDIYRCERLGRRTASPYEAIGVVLTDRLFGFAGLLAVLGLAGLVHRPAVAPWALLAILVCIVLARPMVRRIEALATRLVVKRRTCEPIGRPTLRRRIQSLAGSLVASVRALLASPGRLGVVVVLSVIVQLLACMIYVCADRFVGLGAPIGCYLVAVPLLALAQFLPIHIAGIGIIEGGLWAFLAAWNAGTAADALAVSVAVRVIGLSWTGIMSLSFLIPLERIDNTKWPMPDQLMNASVSPGTTTVVVDSGS